MEADFCGQERRKILKRLVQFSKIRENVGKGHRSSSSAKMIGHLFGFFQKQFFGF